MDDVFAKEYLHDDLREVRAVMLWKLDGLSEYDIRRPLASHASREPGRGVVMQPQRKSSNPNGFAR